MGVVEDLSGIKSPEKLLSEAQHLYFKAVQGNQLELVKEILTELDTRFQSENADLSKRNQESNSKDGNWANQFVLKKSGDFALHICAKHGFIEIIRYLVEDRNANIEQNNPEGKTPLHDAAQCSQLDVVNYLIQRGCNVNVVKRADWTPLMLACTKEDPGVISALLVAGAELNFVNKDGWNCIHIAARVGNPTILKILLDKASEKEGRISRLIQAKSRNGRKPIHTAVMHGHLEATRLLVSHSSVEEVNSTDHCGTSALMDACRCGHSALVEYLVEDQRAKGNLYAEDKTGLNSLHIAAESGQSQIIHLLITKFGMDVDVQTKEFRMSALHWAAKEGHVTAVKALIDLGARRDLKDSKIRTARDLALTYNHHDVSKLLN